MVEIMSSMDAVQDNSAWGVLIGLLVNCVQRLTCFNVERNNMDSNVAEAKLET